MSNALSINEIVHAAVFLSVFVLGPALIVLSTLQKTLRRGISVALVGLIFFEALPLWYSANYMKMEPREESSGVYVFTTGKDWRERKTHCYAQTWGVLLRECGDVVPEEMKKLRLICGVKPYRFEERDPLREISVEYPDGGKYYRPASKKKHPVFGCEDYRGLTKD